MAGQPQLAYPPRRGLSQLLQLALLGAAVGVVCWPLNQIDRLQDALLQRLPAFGAAWSGPSLVLLLLPIPVLPLLLVLQARVWSGGAGSGIPQTLACLEDPGRSSRLLSPAPTLQRLGLWTIASLSLLPLGREGPVVQLGAALLVALRRRLPWLLGWMGESERLAVAGAAGLAAGFNTPLVAVFFLLEELVGGLAPALLWPGLLVMAMAALVSGLGGQPEFAFGELAVKALEPWQLFWAVPFGLGAGLLGALFSRLLLVCSGWCRDRVRRRPLAMGLGLGVALAALGLLSAGAGGGDGEALMAALVQHGRIAASTPLALLARLLGPILALAAGVPGGLIDPALALGSLLGSSLGDLLGIGPLALALAMVASLAAATQLPLMSLMFALRLAGDQQLLPGMLLAAVLGAAMGRLLMRRGVYHALAAGLE